MMFMPPLPLVGSRVLLRLPRESDVLPLYALESDPYVKGKAGGVIDYSWEKYRTNAEQYITSGNWPTLVIEHIETGDFVGRAALSRPTTAEYIWEENSPELVVFIARSYIGNGVGREVSELLITTAFAFFKADCVVAYVEKTNDYGISLVGSLGFVQCDSDGSRLGFRLSL